MKKDKLSVYLRFVFLLVSLCAVDSFAAATVLFPPPKTAVTEKFISVACKGDPNAVVTWQHLKSAGVVSGQSKANGEGVFVLTLDLERGINRIAIEGTFVEVYSDQGQGQIPPGFVKRRAHAGDVSACTDCHDKFTGKLLEKGYPAVCLSCHVVISQNPDNPADPSENAHFRTVVSQCNGCHEPHFSQSLKLLEPTKTRRPCAGCHKEKYAGEESHKAFEEGGCSACHDSHFSGYPHALHKYMPQACSECHSQGGTTNAKNRHPPSSDPSQYCQSCHNPHSNTPKLLAGGVTDTCKTCHPKILKAGHKNDLASCDKCHDPHQPLGTGLLKKNFPAGCEECHDDVRKGANLHQPVSKGCSSCHAPHSDDNRQKALQLCLKCHEFGGGSEVSKLHGGLPLEVKNCRMCHEPHSAAQPKLLKNKTHYPLTQGKCDACHQPGSEKTFKVTNQGVRCDKCHSTVRDLNAKGAKLHEPVKDGDCSSCHDPHMSKLKAYLGGPMIEVCSQCHDKIKPAEGQKLHPAASSCRDCHGVHGGEQKKFLKSQPPKLCIECHDDPAAKKKVVHPALDEGCTSCHSPHSGYGKAFLKKKDSGVCFDCHKNPSQGHKVQHAAMDEGCTSCHNPHASDSKKLLKKPDGPLCITCHKDPAAGGTPHPALDDGCTSCHKPHGSETKKLLGKPADKLCLDCHDNPVKDKKFAHQAMDEGCTSCHDPHVSKAGKLLAKPVNDVCAGCHDNLKKHHVLDASAAKSWPKDKGVFPVVGGKLSCLGCHLPHASNDRKLFSKPEGDICSSCH